ncbi:MAG: undecaprenyl/decaprenyl-phosphate alpha-N-acetylglucosaminyl 1-phosphate transferase, partial [Deltaproteobacteria bacterium]|nr:undecaprenyl/decaprenyl-phosphate alpha-N-acetylglucosaminyl 1-phosphate transferase [Deltaproteobacteria bacterium]
SFCLTPLFRYLAIKWGLLDSPDARKIHKKATPLLGGAAIFVAFGIGILINGVYSTELFAILAASSIVFVTGLIDDFKEVPASIKLFVQVVSTVLVMSFGIVLRVFPTGLGPFSQVLNIALTVLWVVGITNAMNFFDGMDGLATGLGFLGWIAVAMMGSCLGFLPYNFRSKRSASIFLGDGGSTFIGFLLACLAVYGDWSESNPIVALASPVLIFWVLIFDMAHITVDRIVTGKVLSFKEWIEYVGKDHLHHRLSSVLGGPKKAVLFIYFLSLALGISAVVLRNARTIDAILLLLQALLIVLLVTILERHGHGLSGNDKT